MHTAISLEVQALTSTVSYPTPNRATILNLSDFGKLSSEKRSDSRISASIFSNSIAFTGSLGFKKLNRFLYHFAK